MIDLHIHSEYSDGSWNPREIVEDSIKKGLKIISITDHDVLAGYEEALFYRNNSLKIIPGIELNTDGPLGELHILGYNFDPENPSLREHVSWRVEDRLQWGKRIVAKLKMLGFNISFENCLARVGKGVLVRTHIADELVEAGYFHSSKQAYEELLKKGKTGFVERGNFSAVDAIKLIHEAGGLAFLAHPGIYKHKFNVQHLIDSGLDGIEVYHSKHSKEDQEYWRGLAVERNLLISGGSDFHGPESRNPFPIGSVEIEDPQILVRFDDMVP
ncbi:PHP domain-containing protein [Niallia sp. FSL W8-0635]|uniref:PHP domain-containing protein n=1 Tax=Niallia sp. FSL W8-0635 TaxID=2975337 RepID=UPI002B0312A1|nr:PHP domain-containing protein [Yersinia enterocolitica]